MSRPRVSRLAALLTSASVDKDGNGDIRALPVPFPASPRLGMRTRMSPPARPGPGLGQASSAAAVAGPGTMAVAGDVVLGAREQGRVWRREWALSVGIAESALGSDAVDTHGQGEQRGYWH